jgi:hypothetical protein
VNTELLLTIIAILLLLILWVLFRIDRRLKAQFPTDKEQDYDWSQKDPVGHWEAHNKENEK